MYKIIRALNHDQIAYLISQIFSKRLHFFHFRASGNEKNGDVDEDGSATSVTE